MDKEKRQERTLFDQIKEQVINIEMDTDGEENETEKEGHDHDHEQLEEEPTTTTNATAAAAAAAAAIAERDNKLAMSSVIPIVMPSEGRAMKKKFLVECASAGENDFADLDGDSGAVGRVALRKSKGDDGESGNTSLAFDLKGIIYDASFVPSVSVMVIQRTGDQGEAKVEAVFNSFVRLEERAGQEDILVWIYIYIYIYRPK